MRQLKFRTIIPQPLALAAVAIVASHLFAASALGAVPGITGPVFNLRAEASHISQPDGVLVYSWGYGCDGAPAGSAPSRVPLPSTGCPTMQIPGPTLIVTEGQTVTVRLTNALPAAAGNTSILFPGFLVTTQALDPGVPGLLTSEASGTGAPGTHTVTYTFDTTGKAGTHAYYSGTQGDLQVEMGLYGVIVVVPSTVPAGCRALGATLPNSRQPDFRLAASAYDNSSTCYDREYLFQFSEIDPAIHRQAEEQASLPCTNTAGCMNVVTEDYHPAYFMINGRSMPDDMDPNYAPQYPHQPYNGNPHMNPGDLTLLRIVGTGRWQHPFHEHGNHVRVLARDGNLIVSQTDAAKLAGPLLFTTTTTPGQTMDGIFYWTGKGLNWDVYAHRAGDGSQCVPDANGYYTGPAAQASDNYYEWCADHLKALEKNPLSDQIPGGGPVTLPDPNIVVAGPWYGGSPYLGPDATSRSQGPTPIPPSGTVANDPGAEAGFAYMWHSHNEREITTNNAFPGGAMMMMLVDPPSYTINEAN